MLLMLHNVYIEFKSLLSVIRYSVLGPFLYCTRICILKQASCHMPLGLEYAAMIFTISGISSFIIASSCLTVTLIN
jgi:hypothetical protein